MMKKDPKAIIGKILEKIKNVGFQFEDHPDFKEVYSFENKGNLLRTVERAIENLCEDEKLNRIEFKKFTKKLFFKS